MALTLARDLLRGAAEVGLYAVAGVLSWAAVTAMVTAARAYSSMITAITAGTAVPDVSYLSSSSPALAVLAGLSALAALALALTTPEAMGASIDEMLEEYHHRAAGASARGVAVKLVATPLAVGGGSPVGMLGPAAYVGGSLGGLLGSLTRAGFGLRRRLFIAGIAGAVSTALRAPLGAVFFALEIPYHRDLEAGADTAVAAGLGSFTAFIVSGVLSEQALPAGFSVGGYPLSYVAGALLVGVLAGMVGRAFTRIYHLGISFRRGSPILSLALVPALTASVVLASPMLGGSGAGVIEGVLGGDPLPAAAALLIFGVRLGVSPLASGAGLPGGLFGPGLVLGALLGLLTHSATGVGDPSVMVVAGMASFYGSVSTTPIGSSILAAEVSGNYFLAVPALVSALIAREVLGREYLYVNQKERRLREAIALVRDVAEAVKRAGGGGARIRCVSEGAGVVSVDELDPATVASSVRELPSVVLVRGSVAGVVTAESLARYYLSGDDPVERAPIVRCGADVREVVDLMTRYGSVNVVVAGDGYYVLGVDEVMKELIDSVKKG